MKISTKVSLAALGALLWCTPANAQTINIGPNQYAFQYTIDPDFGLFFNSTNVRYEFRNGSAAPIFAFSANSGAMSTNLTFGNGADMLIGNNRYAFRASSNPNYGLFFNSSTLQYQFLNSAAAPVFAINAGTGEYASDIVFEAGSGVLVKPNTFALRSAVSPLAGLYFGGPEYEFRDLAGNAILALNVNGNARVAGGMKIGNSTANQAGNIRWTGSDFQGYNGSTWASLTAESGWGLTGNAGTIDGTNFIGTTDNIPFNIRVNNQKAGRIDPTLNNAFYGYLSGNANTTGFDNTAYGSNALTANTTGDSNTANGAFALNSNTTGGGNTAIGRDALRSNTIGIGNTSTGVSALVLNTTGNSNSANGFQALLSNTTGSNNTANGAQALFSNTTGFQNTGFGVSALLSNSVGTDNTAVGFQALNFSTGSGNTATGSFALVSNTSGSNNTAVGYLSLANNTTIGGNSAFGSESLVANTTGGGNTGLGTKTLEANTIGSSNTAAGFQSMRDNTGDQNSGFGYNALISNTTGTNNTAIGFWANVASGALTNAAAIGANAIVDASNRMVLGAPGTAIQFNGELRPNNLPGTAGQVLTSQGPGTAPTWANAGGGFSTLNTIPKGDGTTLVASNIFDNGTNVGIGTSTPSGRLHVANSNWNTGSMLVSASAGTAGSTIRFTNPDVGNRTYDIIGSTGTGAAVGVGSFAIWDNTSGSYRFTINPSGQVGIGGSLGIGTDTPVAKLDVNFNQPDATNNRAINVLMNGFSDNTTNSIGIRSQLIGNGSLNNSAVVGTVSGASAFDGSNIGGLFQSESAFENAFGIRSTALDGGLVRNYGVYGESFGTTGTFNGGGMFFGLANEEGVGSDFNVYGVYGLAENIGAGPAYSVYGDASATTDFAGFFNGNVEVIGVFNNPSDERLKTNINPLTNSLDKLKLLNVYTYNFDAKGAYSSLNLPSGMQYGFMAQEIETVFPELVRENRVPAKGMAEGETVEISNATYKSVNNMGLIPVLTKAIQEQQKTIEEQHESIEALIGSVGDLVQENSELRSVLSKALSRIDFVEQDLQTCCFNSEAGSKAGTNNNPSEAAGLGQNIPNPFSESTIIRYYLPEGSVNAIIRITNMEGKPIKDLRLGDQRGANQVEFQTESLASGTYLYTLFVDGKFIDTKKMMVVR